MLDQKVKDYYKRQEIENGKKERIREVTKAEEEHRRALNDGKSKKIEDVFITFFLTIENYSFFKDFD